MARYKIAQTTIYTASCNDCAYVTLGYEFRDKARDDIRDHVEANAGRKRHKYA